MIDLSHSRNLAAHPRAGCFLALTEPVSGRQPVLALLTRLLWATALLLPAFGVQASVVFTVLHSFQAFPNGANPQARLVPSSDGSFYGTTLNGGTYTSAFGGDGSVFKISTNGVLTSLYSFDVGNGSDGPWAGLVQGRDGSFYGTTYGGGTGGSGSIFRLTIVPAAPVFQAVMLTNSTLNMAWSTEAGGKYQLQFSSDLSSSNWTNLNPILTAAGATLSTTDPVANGPRRFYRLVRMP